MSWESLREQEGALRLMRVPTDLERAGNFSQTLDTNGKLVALKDPLSPAACNAPGGAGCFPGNAIPASRFHPAAAVLRSYYPSPNLSGGANNYRASAVTKTRWDSFLYKIDHRLTDRDTLSVRFTHRWDDTRSPFDGSELGTFGGRTTPGTMLGGISYTRTFSPAVINELRAGFSREKEGSAPSYLGRNIAAELGIPGTTSDPNLVGFPAFKIRDMPSIGDAVQPPHHLAVNTYEAADTVTWVRSGHTIKFGGALLRGQVFHIDNKNVRGTFNFQGRWTNAPFGDFLLGMLNTATRAASPTPIYVFNTDVGSFVQDDFRVRPNLTLNLGLRYEYSAPLHEKYGRFAGFVPEIGKLVIADDRAVPNLENQIRTAGLQGRVALAGEAGLPESLSYANKTNFAPRFGFAWRPRGKNNMAIRGGYGIFYAATSNNPIRLDLGSVFPFAATETYTRDTRQPNLVTLSTPFPESLGKIGGVNDVAGQELRPAPQYLQSWNLTVEKQVSGATALEIGYTGSKGTHLGRQVNVNTPDRKLPLMRADGTFPRPFEQFNNIRLYRFDSNSTYNAGILTVRRRFANNFFYRISYTFAKSLDYGSQISGQDRGGGGPLDPRNRQLDRGRSNWDTRHGFTTTFSYRTPARLGRWLGGWQAAGTGRMASGRPFTPSTSNAQEDLGEGSRPDRIAFGTLPNPGPERWFDTSAFPLVPLNSYRFGNSGRNILDGAGMVVFNLSFMKNFRLRENRHPPIPAGGIQRHQPHQFQASGPQRQYRDRGNDRCRRTGQGLSGRAALRILMRPIV